MIFTFYSFKGGVGRSMAAANIAKWFYLQGLRVIMIDWDLEAPGLENFFFPSTPTLTPTPSSEVPSIGHHTTNKRIEITDIYSRLGLMDLIDTYRRRFAVLPKPLSADTRPFMESVTATMPAMDAFLYRVEPRESDDEPLHPGLWLLPAGLRGGERFGLYAQLVQGFDWEDFYTSYQGLLYFEWMREQLSRLADVVIIDSRTGVTEMGGVCTRQLADVVVCFCAPNFQNLGGLASMVASFNHPDVIKLRGRQVEVVAVPSKLDNSETDLQNAFEKEFEQTLNEVPRVFRKLKTTFWNLRIPYVAKYAYREKLAIGEPDRNRDLELAYRNLALHLAALAPENDVIRNRCDEQLSQVFRGLLSGGFLFNVPDLPPNYIPRQEELDALKEALLGTGATAITGRGSALGLQGMGGIGKSILAAALARDVEIRDAFRDGIYWLSLGQRPAVAVLQRQLVSKITGVDPAFTTVEEGKSVLRAAFEGRRALLILDDAWSLGDVGGLDVASSQAQLLVTTRNGDVLIGLGAREHRIDVLSPRDALSLLAAWSGEEMENLPPEATEIARKCGYLPLALAMVGSMVRLRPTGWNDALTRLKQADLGSIAQAFPSYPYKNLLRAIEVSIEALEGPDRERYLDMAVFPPGQPIPEGALGALWGLDIIDTRDCMTRFVARSLATWVTGDAAILLHDLLNDAIYKWREKELSDVHLRLLENWDALPRLPDQYAWRWIGYHLVKAGRNEDLRRLLLNFDYLHGKLFATDANALIADYDYLPEDKDLQLVQSALRLSAHVLARDPRQLAGQLVGRLQSEQAPEIKALLEHISNWRALSWIRPCNASLIPPGGPLVRTLSGNNEAVRAVAITADGRYVISGSDDNTLRVWDLATGETKTTLRGHSSSVFAVAVTSDGRYVVSGSNDHMLRVWDLATGETKTTLRGHKSSVFAVAVAPDGRHVVSGSDDKTLRLWDLETGQALRTLEGHREGVRAVAIMADGRYVISGSDDKTLRLWDLGTGQALRTLEGHREAVRAAAITANGRYVISGSDDKTLKVSELATGKTVTTLQGHTNSVNAVAITPDGRHVVSGSSDRTLRVWSWVTAETAMTLLGHSSSVTAMAVAPDGRHVVSASADRTLRVWDLETGQTLQTPQGHREAVYAVAVTADGRRAVSASADRKLRLWDLETGQALRTLEGHREAVYAVAVTADGRRAISASEDRTLRLWDLETGQALRTLEGHREAVYAVAVTADGRRAISASADRTLRLWDLETGRALRTLEGHSGEVRAVAVTADGRHAVSASADGTLRVWSLESGQSLSTLDGQHEPVYAVALTPDGHRAVSASGERMLCVWDLKTGQALRRHEGYSGGIRALTVTADGRHAVLASRDGTLRVWNLDRAEEIATFTGDGGSIVACAVASDSHTIVAGDQMGRMHFLKLIEGDATKSPVGETEIPLLLHERQFISRLGESVSMPHPNPRRVFIIYAEADNKSRNPKERWLDRFIELVKPLIREGDFTLCSDEDIKFSQNWHQHVQTQLDGAKAVVLLVSPALLASEYIANSELPVILKNAADEGIRIFPILISPSLFTRAKYKYPDPKTGPQEFSLASLKAVNSPSRTVVEMTEGEQNRVLERVADDIAEVLSEGREDP